MRVCARFDLCGAQTGGCRTISIAEEGFDVDDLIDNLCAMDQMAAAERDKRLR